MSLISRQDETISRLVLVSHATLLTTRHLPVAMVKVAAAISRRERSRREIRFSMMEVEARSYIRSAMSSRPRNFPSRFYTSRRYGSLASDQRLALTPRRALPSIFHRDPHTYSCFCTREPLQTTSAHFSRGVNNFIVFRSWRYVSNVPELQMQYFFQLILAFFSWK